MQEKIVAILKAQLDLAEMKMRMDLEAQKNMMMINKGGDVVNQSSNTFQAGTLLIQIIQIRQQKYLFSI